MTETTKYRHEDISEPKAPRPAAKRAAFIYFAAALAVLAAAFFGWRAVAPAAALRDVFSGAASTYDFILCAARLLLPILSEFLAVYAFSFSPLCMTACLAALAVRGARVAFAAGAALSAQSASFRDLAAFVPIALGAVALAAFCASSLSLSPRLRRIGFSTFDGRREALFHTVVFLILSGAATVFTLASALAIRFM